MKADTSQSAEMQGKKTMADTLEHTHCTRIEQTSNSMGLGCFLLANAKGQETNMRRYP